MLEAQSDKLAKRDSSRLPPPTVGRNRGAVHTLQELHGFMESITESASHGFWIPAFAGMTYAGYSSPLRLTGSCRF